MLLSDRLNKPAIVAEKFRAMGHQNQLMNSFAQNAIVNYFRYTLD